MSSFLLLHRMPSLLSALALSLFLLFLTTMHIHYKPTHGRTMSDDIDEMKKRNGTVLIGSIAGDISTIKAGHGEGGDYNSMLSEFMGESILRLGVAYHDFPVCPAVHLSFFMGSKANLDTAFYLAKVGANVNDYRLPDPYWDEFDPNADFITSAPKGYPPAMLYALGLGKPPTNSHAAFLSRFLESAGSTLNMTAVKTYLALTGNPPLIHMAILRNFFDGVYVLAGEYKQNVNSLDFHGLTPLHVASWLGDTKTISFLLFAGANRFTVDMLRRIPLHYAVMRGNVDAIELLLTYNNMSGTSNIDGDLGNSYGNSNSNTKSSSSSSSNSKSKSKPALTISDIAEKSLNHKDMFGFTAVDLAEVHPPIQPSIAEVNRIVKLHKLKDKLFIDLKLKFINRIAKGKVYRRASFSKETSDSDHIRGGWRYSFDIARDRLWNESLEIDKYTIAASSASASVSSSSDAEKWKGSRTMPRKLRNIGVDILDCQSEAFDRDYFSRDYVLNQRPVILSNMPISTNAIWAYWRRPEFVSMFGNFKVLSGEKMYTEHAQAWNIPKVTRNKVSTFIDIHMKASLTPPTAPASIVGRSTEKQCQATDGNVDGSCIAKDPVDHQTVDPPSTLWVGHVDLSNLTHSSFMSTLRPDFLNLCGSRDKEPFRMTLGPRGSGTPIHSHNASWSVLLFGVKKWYLVAPGLGNQSLWDEEKDIGTNIRVPSAQEWIDKKAPNLRKLGLVHEVYQYPGDIIYIPHNWWHVTINIEDSASITQEVCTFRNTNLRVQPLGFALYGGEDPHRGIGRSVHYHLSIDKRYDMSTYDEFKKIIDKDKIKIPMF